MTVVYRALDIPLADFTEAPLAPPVAEPLSGEILARNIFTWATDDHRIVTGAWECEPGLSRWSFTHIEIITVLAGAMTVTADGSEPVELTAGSTAVFPVGWSGTWQVTERLRKTFAVILDPAEVRQP